MFLELGEEIEWRVGGESLLFFWEWECLLVFFIFEEEEELFMFFDDGGGFIIICFMFCVVEFLIGLLKWFVVDWLIILEFLRIYLFLWVGRIKLFFDKLC